MVEKELYTIAEYAEARRISKQAVYQQLNKKLKPFVKVIDGKKYLTRDAFQVVDSTEVEKGFSSFQPDSSAVEKAVEPYKKQVEEKEKIIADLLERLAKEQEQTQRITALLEREQEINRNSQILLLNAQKKNELPEEPKKKKGIFALFSKKENKK